MGEVLSIEKFLKEKSLEESIKNAERIRDAALAMVKSTSKEPPKEDA